MTGLQTHFGNVLQGLRSQPLRQKKKKEASIPIECLIRGHKRDEERVRYNGKKGKKETKCLLIQGKKGNPINELI